MHNQGRYMSNIKSITPLVPQELIECRIFLIREKKVMSDSDLAELYGVTTKVLLQAVRRNIIRFPEDFMYHLTNKEVMCLRSQFVTSNSGRGGRRYAPYVFTEQGIAMLSSILHSKKAVLVNIQIMRTFIKLKEMVMNHKDLQQKIEKIESKYDKQFRIVFDAIKSLLQIPEKPKGRIGFHP